MFNLVQNIQRMQTTTAISEINLFNAFEKPFPLLKQNKEVNFYRFSISTKKEMNKQIKLRSLYNKTAGASRTF